MEVINNANTITHNLHGDNGIGIGPLLQSLIIEAEQVAEMEEVLLKACMDGLQKSDEIMADNMQHFHSESAMEQPECSTFTSTRNLGNQKSNTGVHMRSEYEEIVK